MEGADEFPRVRVDQDYVPEDTSLVREELAPRERSSDILPHSNAAGWFVAIIAVTAMFMIAYLVFNENAHKPIRPPGFTEAGK